MIRGAREREGLQLTPLTPPARARRLPAGDGWSEGREGGRAGRAVNAAAPVGFYCRLPSWGTAEPAESALPSLCDGIRRNSALHSDEDFKCDAD